MVKLYPISIPNQLNVVPSYGEICQISTLENDVFTTSQFKELMENQFSRKLNYILVIWKDELKNHHMGDGFYFVRNTLQHDSQISPLTRSKINDYKIYQISPNSLQFELLCGKEEVVRTDSLFRYIIGAHDQLIPLRERLSYLRCIISHYQEANDTKTTRKYQKIAASLNDPLQIFELAKYYSQQFHDTNNSKYFIKFYDVIAELLSDSTNPKEQDTSPLEIENYEEMDTSSLTNSIGVKMIEMSYVDEDEKKLGNFINAHSKTLSKPIEFGLKRKIEEILLKKSTNTSMDSSYFALTLSNLDEM